MPRLRTAHKRKSRSQDRRVKSKDMVYQFRRMARAAKHVGQAFRALADHWARLAIIKVAKDIANEIDV